MKSGPVLETDRFILRPLQIDDANEHYLSWFNDPGAGNITAQKTTHNLDDLQHYVGEKIALPNVLFLGIFQRDTDLHVGNIKFEPVDRERGYAIFGILIGEPAFRGKGVAGEVIEASARWLKAQGLREIVLGVSMENARAIRAYEKAGFRIAPTEHLPETQGAERMVLIL